MTYYARGSGSFELVLILRSEHCLTGFDDNIIAMCAHGVIMRKVQVLPLETYGVQASAKFIRSVTDPSWPKSALVKSPILEPICPVAFFDTLWLKIREDAVVRTKATYFALILSPGGTRDIPSSRIECTEDAKF